MDSFEEDRFAEEESNDNVKPYQDVDDDVKPSQDVDDDDYKPQRNTTDIEDEGKLFVGGLRRDTTSVEFVKHFEKYGEITDSVIMKDKDTGMPRGFGFVTFADSSVTDKVLQDAHILSGRKVDVKRALPQGSENSDEFKTKKIFVGGIPSSVDDDEFKEFFMQFGEVKDHLIIRDHTSGKSRGFGFITYESKEMVDLLLAKGNRIELGGTLVELKKAEPKKPNSASLPSRRSGDSRSSFSGDSYGGGYGGSGGPYMSTGGYGSGRSGGYEGEFGGYGGGYGSGVGPYRGEPASGYGGGGSGYNSGGYGMGGNSGGYGGGPGDMSGGPYGEPGGGYSEPSASYGGGPYGEPGGGYSGPSASYGGGPGDMNGGPYGEPGGSYGGPSASYGGGYGTGGSGLGGYGGTGNEGYNRGGGRYDGGHRRGGGGGGGGGGESRGHGSSSRYHPYGR